MGLKEAPVQGRGVPARSPETPGEPSPHVCLHSVAPLPGQPPRCALHHPLPGSLARCPARSPFPRGRRCGSAPPSGFLGLAFTWEPGRGAAGSGLPQGQGKAGGRVGGHRGVRCWPWLPVGSFPVLGSGFLTSGKEDETRLPLYHLRLSVGPGKADGPIQGATLSTQSGLWSLGRLLLCPGRWDRHSGAKGEGCGTPEGTLAPAICSHGVPGLEVLLGVRAADGVARGSSGAFLLAGGLGGRTETLGPVGGLLPFRGWLRSTSAARGQEQGLRALPWCVWGGGTLFCPLPLRIQESSGSRGLRRHPCTHHPLPRLPDPPPRPSPARSPAQSQAHLWGSCPGRAAVAHSVPGCSP